MLLCDELIWAIPDGASGIEFNDAEDGKYFVEQFNREWEAAVEEVAKEHEDCLRDNPATIVEDSEDRFLVTFVPLDIPFMLDAFCDIDRGPEAVEKALAALKCNNPDAEYHGCIQFAWSDQNGGDVIKFDVSSKQNDDPYPFVGEILKESVEDDDFWESVEDSDEIEEIAEDLKRYIDWVGEDAIERLSELEAD